MEENIKKILEKQLELLSERSKECITDSELVGLTHAMVKTARLLKEF